MALPKFILPLEHEREDWYEDELGDPQALVNPTGFDKIAATLERLASLDKSWRPPVDEELERTFQDLKRKWEAETIHLSSPTGIFQNIYYQQIIGLGSSVVPLLLKDMQKEQNLWFWALYMISRENPVEKDSVGNLDKMTEDWLKWGRLKGHI